MSNMHVMPDGELVENPDHTMSDAPFWNTADSMPFVNPLLMKIPAALPTDGASETVLCDVHKGEHVPHVGCVNAEPQEHDHSTHYTVHVTLEADLPTVPHTFDTWDEAEAHAQFVTTLLASTAEPQPAHATHDAQGSTYTTAGHHELYGEWSVALTVRD